jgi:hypothetical protein
MARCDLARSGLVWLARSVTARSGRQSLAVQARPGTVLFGMVWFGWLGWAGCVVARSGAVRAAGRGWRGTFGPGIAR